MWMEENIGRRINILRVEQAVPHRPQVIATACPYCATMMSDGTKALGRESEIATRDIAELVADALTESPRRDRALCAEPTHAGLPAQDSAIVSRHGGAGSSLRRPVGPQIGAAGDDPCLDQAMGDLNERHRSGLKQVTQCRKCAAFHPEGRRHENSRRHDE
jgi:hypothetical protein